MSHYEAYDETSRHYDRTRIAVGSEIILGCLARADKPLGELTVLDAGCGTGAYSQATVGRVGRGEARDKHVRAGPTRSGSDGSTRPDPTIAPLAGRTAGSDGAQKYVCGGGIKWARRTFIPIETRK